jgi:hypothetical protein
MSIATLVDDLFARLVGQVIVQDKVSEDLPGDED